MRQIGKISNVDQAERFADHLRAEGTACSIDKDGDEFRIWVHDDDRVAVAKQELPQFLAEPNHQRYQDSARRAMQRARDDLNRQRAIRKNTVVVSEKWNRPIIEQCPLTIGLIAITGVVAYFIGIEPEKYDPRVVLFWFSTDGTLKQILNGEVWRLISPIFVHGSVPHLVFNMFGMQQFGMLVESRVKSLKFLGMVLVIAVVSNFAQFWFGHGFFCGMSGVVYGLFGYVWVKGKLDPQSGFELPQQTITMMLVWHVLCMAGVIGNVANWAHGGGLVMGIAIAFGGSLLKPILQRK